MEQARFPWKIRRRIAKHALDVLNESVRSEYSKPLGAASCLFRTICGIGAVRCGAVQENKEAREVLAGGLGMPEGMKALKEQVCEAAGWGAGMRVFFVVTLTADFKEAEQDGIRGSPVAPLTATSTDDLALVLLAVEATASAEAEQLARR